MVNLLFCPDAEGSLSASCEPQPILLGPIMPTWICPTCSASMTVSESAIGQREFCTACKRKAVVIDASKAGPEVPITSFSKAILSIVAVVETALAFGFAMSGPKGFELMLVLLAGAISTGIALVVVWPIYTMVEDTRANRRLLEELLKK